MQKVTILTVIIIENRNTAAAARSAHFPITWKVVEVESMLYKAQSGVHTLYPAFAYKPFALAIVASFHCHLYQSSFYGVNGEERLEEKGRVDGQGVEEVPEQHEVPQRPRRNGSATQPGARRLEGARGGELPQPPRQ